MFEILTRIVSSSVALLFFLDAIWRPPSPPLVCTNSKTIRLHLSTDSTTLQSADRKQQKNASTQRVQLGNEEKGSDIRTCATAPVLRPNAVTVYGAKKIFQIQRSSLASRPCQLRAQRPKRLLEYERARWVSSAEQKIIFCPTSQHILSPPLHLLRRKKSSLWYSTPLRQEDQQSDINLDRPTLLQ